MGESGFSYVGEVEGNAGHGDCGLNADEGGTAVEECEVLSGCGFKAYADALPGSASAAGESDDLYGQSGFGSGFAVGDSQYPFIGLGCRTQGVGESKGLNRTITCGRQDLGASVYGIEPLISERIVVGVSCATGIGDSGSFTYL